MAQKRFRKGDRVEFTFGIRTVQATVIEDRGPIGVGGRHLYAVRFLPDLDSSSALVAEMPAEELTMLEPVRTR
jgi:hypothetical protein